MRIALAIFLLAVQANAATRYVSKTGNGTAPFLTWDEASTNIQFAINAAEAGDTILVAPGIYNESVTINKNLLTVQGGNGTLWDADRTIIDRQGAGQCVLMNASNSILRGFTLTGGVVGSGGGGGAYLSGGNTTIDSCVVRGNVATGNGSGVALFSGTAKMENCIVVGNAGTYAVLFNTQGATMINSIVEANEPSQILPFNVAYAYNSIYGNISATPQNLLGGGNVTNATSNSVVALLGIAPGSVGIGSNLVWAGVGAYIPRIGSLAQGAGGGYAGIDTAKSGDGGPALLPIGAKFLGCDSSTNGNHGTPVGGVAASTNSPFAGGGSASFGGANWITLGTGAVIPKITNSTAVTVEMWLYPRRIAANNDALSFSINTGYGGLRAGVTTGGFFIGSRSREADTFQQWTVGCSVSNWTHVAGVFNYAGKWSCIYSNGALISSNAAVAWGTNRFNPTVLQEEYIGRCAPQIGATAYYLGYLTDIRIWNVARTTSEIATSYTNRLTGTEPGLVGYWRLDERDAPITTGPFNIRNPTLQPSFMEAF